MSSNDRTVRIWNKNSRPFGLDKTIANEKVINNTLIPTMVNWNKSGNII